MTSKSNDKKGEAGLGDLTKMLDPKNMERFLPMFVASGSKDFVEQQIDSVNMMTQGPGLLAVRISFFDLYSESEIAFISVRESFAYSP